MSRLAAVVCVFVVGCSHDSRPVESAEYAAEPAATPTSAETPAGAQMRPASLEASRQEAREHYDAPATTPAPQLTPPRTDASATAPAPAPAEPARDTLAAPDNTRVNERDRDSANLTSGDQGNSESDLRITQQIRREVMADKVLSFTAKNVKIITRDGKVTLRGPVKTAEERAAIEADARRAAASASIDNQIEVKK